MLLHWIIRSQFCTRSRPVCSHGYPDSHPDPYPNQNPHRLSLSNHYPLAIPGGGDAYPDSHDHTHRDHNSNGFAFSHADEYRLCVANANRHSTAYLYSVCDIYRYIHRYT